MHEIGVFLADTAWCLAEDPTSGMDTLGAAGDVMRVRDHNRLRARGEVPLGEVAGLSAGWLIRRADHGDLAAAVQVARLAASGSPEQTVLREELREFVRGDLDGSISGEEVTRRQKHSRAPLTEEQTAATVAGDPIASAAAAVLTDILAEVSGPAASSDAVAAWDAFKRFATLPVTPEPPERLEERGGDMLLCEFGVYNWPWSSLTREVFLVDLVRQFSILGVDGEYDSMEHVHCSIAFDPKPELRRLASNTIWSDPDRRREWFADVEQSDAFVALRTALPLEVCIEHTPV